MQKSKCESCQNMKTKSNDDTNLTKDHKKNNSTSSKRIKVYGMVNNINTAFYVNL